MWLHGFWNYRFRLPRAREVTLNDVGKIGQYSNHNKTRQSMNRMHNSVDALQWRHNGRDSVSNHQPHHCLLNRLFRRRSKKTSKLRVTGLCVGNSPGTGEFPAQMAKNAENGSIWWRHHGTVEKHYWVTSSTYCSS